MGITIHYGGRLAEPGRIREFTEELADIGRSMDWETQVFDHSWEEPVTLRMSNDGEHRRVVGNSGLKGVSIHPHPDSETFFFTFNAEGFLDYPTRILLQIPFFGENGTPHLWGKTQFAGPAVHIQMIRLLRYLKRKYIPDLWVTDEAEFWESENEATLVERMDFLNGAIDYFRNGLSDGRSLDELARDW